MSAATSVPEAEPPRSGAAACDSAMLDALLAQAPMGFAFIDTDLRLRRVGHALAEMIGTKPAEQIGRSPAEVWPPALAASTESAVRKVLADGLPVSDGQPGHLADWAAGPDPGEGRQLALSWYPAHDRDGAVAGVTMIAVDVTGGQAAADAVRRTRERYRSLVQAGNQVVWVTDPEGEVAEDSPEWRWITASASCRSSGTAPSSSGWGRAPTSPGSVRPTRCAAG